MFGCIVAEQSVRTDFEMVSENDLVLRLENLQSSYLTIFMTGEKQSPGDLGGAIYISLPASQGESECWNYLGHISNTKTSDTFKIDNLKRMGIDNMTTNNFGNFTGPRIGISVKTLAEIQGLTPGMKSNLG